MRVPPLLLLLLLFIAAVRRKQKGAGSKKSSKKVVPLVNDEDEEQEMSYNGAAPLTKREKMAKLSSQRITKVASGEKVCWSCMCFALMAEAVVQVEVVWRRAFALGVPSSLDVFVWRCVSGAIDSSTLGNSVKRSPKEQPESRSQQQKFIQINKYIIKSVRACVCGKDASSALIAHSANFNERHSWMLPRGGTAPTPLLRCLYQNHTRHCGTQAVQAVCVHRRTGPSSLHLSLGTQVKCRHVCTR